MKYIISILKIIFVQIFIILFFVQCSKKTTSEYERAAHFVKSQCNSEFFIEKDPTFLMIEGRKKPSDWLKYFFSVMSTRNWITENNEYAEYTIGPKIPKNISLQPNSPNVNIKKSQLVIIADDVNNKIMVEGYDSTQSGIVYKEEWDFPNFKK